MTRAFAFATAAALSLSLAASAVQAGPRDDCDTWQCGSNGASLNGLTLNGMSLNGTRYNAIQVGDVGTQDLRQPAADATRPAVNAVVLPSGETIELR